MWYQDPLFILAASLAIVLGSILWLRLHAFLALVLGATAVALLTPAHALERYAVSKKMSAAAITDFIQVPVGERVAKAFGEGAGKVGVLVGLASIIGLCVLESGSAEKLVRSLLKFLGERMAPGALLFAGYLLGIPVFFDTVFLLLIPIVRSLHKQTKKDYVLYIVATVAGATMTHSLVPPTPGPLAVARTLHVDLGTMILMGCVVSAAVCGPAMIFGWWLNLRMTVEPPERIVEYADPTRAPRRTPPLGLAIMPVALPVLLISGQTAAETLRAAGVFRQLLDEPLVHSLLRTFGEPTFALLVTSGFSLWLLVRFGDRTRLPKVLQDAVIDAGGIIMITAAGAAFGGVLQTTGIGDRIVQLDWAGRLGLLPFASLVTSLIRIAQGSATVAMVTAANLVLSMTDLETLPVHPVYLALAIGCGSKPIPWMNDSGFWVVCRTAGFTERQALASITPLISMMGCAGLGVVLLLAWLFPLR